VGHVLREKALVFRLGGPEQHLGGRNKFIVDVELLGVDLPALGQVSRADAVTTDELSAFNDGEGIGNGVACASCGQQRYRDYAHLPVHRSRLPNLWLSYR
jgi:hypothetical protein